MRIGAHMSVAGGVASAVERAVLHGCESLQIFTKNANQWRGRPLDPLDVRAYRRRLDETGIHPVVSHASYLTGTLGLLGVVIHPGTCTAGTDEDALRLIAAAIRDVLGDRSALEPMVLLEHTAGQGRTVGYRFEHLAAILEHLGGDTRVGVCLDTCHLLASGYDIVSEDGYQTTFDGFDRLVGLDRLKVFHGNDSKKPLGSRVDRHEHIGDGHLGLEPFRRLLHDPRFDGLPILLETEKSASAGRAGTIARDPHDVRNLETLRQLRERAVSPGDRPPARPRSTPRSGPGSP